MMAHPGHVLDHNLVEAAFNGDEQGVYTMLQSRISSNDLKLDGYDTRGNPIVNIACRGPKCHPAIVGMLIKAGAPIKTAARAPGFLPQHALVQNFKENGVAAGPDFVQRLCAILDILAATGADFHARNAGGDTALDSLSELLSIPAMAIPFKEKLQEVLD